jgi:TetR/AcrR family transcriptional regulator, transcriptional repressor of bet genes
MTGHKLSEAQRKRQILDAAVRVAISKGLVDLTMRDVAAEAGLSNGLIFFHFQNKETLLLALLDELINWLVIEMVPTSSQSFWEMLIRRFQLRQEEYDRIRLLMEYGVLGVRQPMIRERLGDALLQYRDTFLIPIRMEREASDPPEDVFATLIATLTVGSALQSLIDPIRFHPQLPLNALVTLLRDHTPEDASREREDG